MNLRPLSHGDLDLYWRLYTDPLLWTKLGGVPELDVPVKFNGDLASMQADRHWVLVIVTADGVAAGTVSLWDHEWNGDTINEIGWMVSPNTKGTASRARRWRRR